MELYCLFSNRVKELCIAVYSQLSQDSAMQHDTRVLRINALWVNLELVIRDAERTDSLVEHRYQPSIEPNFGLSPSQRDISSPESDMDSFILDGLSQRYEVNSFSVNQIHIVMVQSANAFDQQHGNTDREVLDSIAKSQEVLSLSNSRDWSISVVFLLEDYV
jgi:hypothetical protein